MSRPASDNGVMSRESAPEPKGTPDMATEAEAANHVSLGPTGRYGLIWEKRLATAWLVVFCVGSLLIIYFPAIQPSRLALPIGAMLLYFGYGLTVNDRHTEKFADSLYFMGFLWTLIALIGALFGGRLAAASVFRAFAYGLVTTAVGMLLRTLVLQFQHTLPDRMVQAQEDMGQAVGRFLAEIGRASEAVNRFRVGAEVRLAEELSSLAS